MGHSFLSNVTKIIVGGRRGRRGKRKGRAVQRNQPGQRRKRRKQGKSKTSRNVASPKLHSPKHAIGLSRPLAWRRITRLFHWTSNEKMTVFANFITQEAANFLRIPTSGPLRITS